jgi:hypothetical protein
MTSAKEATGYLVTVKYYKFDEHISGFFFLGQNYRYK